ncbi:hypothetical protein [Eikenella halliae]|nr:hypothetical protein [Eikenella halliae]
MRQENAELCPKDGCLASPKEDRNTATADFLVCKRLPENQMAALLQS